MVGPDGARDPENENRPTDQSAHQAGDEELEHEVSFWSGAMLNLHHMINLSSNAGGTHELSDVRAAEQVESC